VKLEQPVTDKYTQKISKVSSLLALVLCVLIILLNLIYPNLNPNVENHTEFLINWYVLYFLVTFSYAVNFILDKKNPFNLLLSKWLPAFVGSTVVVYIVYILTCVDCINILNKVSIFGNSSINVFSFVNFLFSPPVGLLMIAISNIALQKRLSNIHFLTGGMVFVISLIELIEYVSTFEISELPLILSFHTVSAFLLFLISVAILPGDGKRNIGYLLNSDTFGGYAARVLIPAAIIVPFSVIWFVHLSFDSILQASQLQTIEIVAVIIFFMILIYISSKKLIYFESLSKARAEFLELTNADLNHKTVLLEEQIIRSKDLEHKLAKELAKEKEASDVKSKFVRLISHEFRTPLSHIKMTGEIIGDIINEADGIDKVDAQSLLDIMNSAANDMATVVQKVSDYFEFDKHINLYEDEDIELVAFIRSFVLEFKANHKITNIVGVYPSHNEIFYTAKIHLLEIILGNLLDNAIKYSSNEKPVNIYINDDFFMLTLIVEDFGIGIDPDDIDDIFQVFRRGSKQEAIGTERGIGIGLPLVKLAVEHLHGDISFESYLNSGTKFIVYLPKDNN